MPAVYFICAVTGDQTAQAYFYLKEHNLGDIPGRWLSDKPGLGHLKNMVKVLIEYPAGFV